jgi:hypothetical protein
MPHSDLLSEFDDWAPLRVLQRLIEASGNVLPLRSTEQQVIAINPVRCADSQVLDWRQRWPPIRWRNIASWEDRLRKGAILNHSETIDERGWLHNAL